MKKCLFLLVVLYSANTLCRSQMIALPKPSGSYTVGVRTYKWTDNSRKETLYDGGGARELWVQIWYPAAYQAGAAKSIYAENLDSTMSAQLYAIYSSVVTNAYVGLPFSKKKDGFPVIVFSTGRATASFSYSILGEELASNGYVFVAVNSPGSSQVFFKDNYMPPLQRWVPPISIYASGDSMDKFFKEPIDILSDDLVFCINTLKELNKSDAFFNKNLDMEHTGLMGHSLGGLAASEACRKYKDSKALFLIESTESGAVRKEGLNVPIGFVISEASLSYDTAHLYTEILKNLKNKFYFFKLKDAGHNSFTDLLLVRRGLFNYKMSPEKGIEMGRSMVVHFFDKTLKNKKGEFEDLKNQFGEITLEIHQ